MIDINQIDKALKNNEIDTDSDISSFINKEIKSKSKEEVADFLCSVPPKEMGGITAMSGFYYQILVTIEYLIELYDGKWDFVAMELHDDIVVGKDNFIKFIQVKTSKQQAVKASESPANGLYSRKNKESKKKKYLINSSWVDKLLSKAELFKKSDDYITEFELHSSYNIFQSPHYNFDYYYDPCSEREMLNKQDDLLDIINKPVFDTQLNNYDYYKKTGESVEELLSRFNLKVGKKLTDLRAYKNHLCVELGERLIKNINGKNIVLSENDLNILIGILCAKCTISEDYMTLIVTKEKLDGLLKEIKERIIQGASETTIQHGNIEVNRQIFDVFINEIKKFPIFDYIKDDIYKYKQYLDKWLLNEGGNIRDLLNRYIDGTKDSESYFELADRLRQEKFEDFISIMIIVNLIHNDVLTFADCESLLSKHQIDQGEDLIAFLSLDKSFDFSFGVKKLQEIYVQLPLKEQIFYDSKNVKTIFQKYSDRSFVASQTIKLLGKDEVPLENFNNEKKLNMVEKVISVMPGEILQDEFYKMARASNREELVKGLKKYWNSL